LTIRRGEAYKSKLPPGDRLDPRAPSGGKVTCYTTSGSHDLVAIGTSAGGVTALQVLIGALPRDLGAAVLVVQHLEPTRESVLAKLIGRRALLPVHPAIDGEAIVPGQVYIAVPDAHLLATGGHVVLTGTAQVHFSRPSIDSLFESVAKSYGPRAIGVILTGSGTDGAQGLRAIKEHGGATIVQDPHEASYPSMPSSAFATGCVDQVLPLQAIAEAIVALVRRTNAVIGDEPHE
jgi:two-component system, chemotaxis family, protein-glutamate methylesterase/glutaminase